MILLLVELVVALVVVAAVELPVLVARVKVPVPVVVVVVAGNRNEWMKNNPTPTTQTKQTPRVELFGLAKPVGGQIILISRAG